MFLGTAGDNLAASKQIKATGGILFEYNDIAFLINPGPGSIIRTKQFSCNPRNLSGIMLTDGSLVSSNDVNCIIDAMTYSGMDKRGLLIGPKEAIDSDNSLLLTEYKEYLEKIIYMEPEKRVGVDELEIFGLPTNKLDHVGYRISTPQFMIGYLGGNPEYSIDITDHLEGCDILILSLKHEASVEEIKDKQLTFNQAAKIISEIKPRLTILTDFSSSVISADPIYQARLLQKETSHQVVAAKDGLTINPKSYARMKHTSPLFKP